jgi:hypothetical protein
VDLSTHCGIYYLHVGATWFEREGGRLSKNGNPPDGWRNPFQAGRVTVTGDVAVFTDDSGHRETFRKRNGPPSSEPACL